MSKLSYWCFLLIVCLPRIPVMESGVSESVIRVDTLLSIILGFVLFLDIFRKRKFFLLFLLISVIFVFFSTGNYSFPAFLYVFMIMSLLYPFHFLRSAKMSDVKILFAAINIMAIGNILAALASRVLDQSLCVNSGPSLEQVNCIIGSYGFSSQPYVFATIIATSLIIYLLFNDKISYVTLLIYFVGLGISDSRSIAFLLTISALYLLLKRSGIKFFVITLLALAGMFLVGGKMSVAYTASLGASDPSWLMRAENINNYIQWLDITKLILGGGFLSFLQFSYQYGSPGPLDMLYFRVLSEVGVLGFFLCCCIFFVQTSKSIGSQDVIFAVTSAVAKKGFYIFIFSLLAIGFFHEVLLVPKAGHMIFLCVAALSARMHQDKYTD